MRVPKILNKLDSLSLTNALILSFVSGLLFPMCAWLIDMIRNNTRISVETIGKMHLENPVLFVVDLIPVLAVLLVWIIIRLRKKDLVKFKLELEKRDLMLNRNARFAMDIGAGHFEREFTLDDPEDVLGKSLLIMRDNLLAGTRKEKDETWISDGKDLISNILRINNKLDELSHEVIVNLIHYTQAIQGALYLFNEEEGKLVNVSTYAYNRKKYINQEFRVGQGLIGQCAYERDIIYRTEIPDDYVTLTSGILGDKKPKSLLIVPLITDEKLQGVIEFASLEPEIPALTLRFMRELGEIIARTIFNLRVNQRTEKLLLEAQKMTTELQMNEEQLRQSAEEMRATQEELQRSNEKLETQIIEVENAQKRLHSLLENASEIISIYDEKMVLKYISPSVTKIFGYTQGEMMKGKDIDRLTRRGETELRNLFNEILEKPEEPRALQYTYMKKDGEKIFIETVGRNLLHDPAIGGIIFNSQDVTARKKAEKEERMKSKMQSLSENSLDMIIRLSTSGQFFYANAVIEDYIGLAPKDVMNKTLSEVELFEGLYAYFDQTIKQVKSKPQKTITELHLPVMFGGKLSERIMSIDAIPEFNENELETILFVGHDITEAKRIEMEIQEKNKKIEDSINYAKRIQKAILPDNHLIREFLPKSFIYYKPRDVVSGDFPWFFHKGDIIYIAVVDCTGHGVPGAMLSFVGYFLLNNIVDREQEVDASHVLDMLHLSVRATLKQDRANAEGRDGMDIAFIKINLKKNEVQFAGAHRPLYFIRNGELTEYKGDRKPIGGIPLGNKPEVDFVNHTVTVEKGDKIFFFSDGLPDQLGGPEKRKYGPARIREAILANNKFTMPEFNDYFENDFETWKQGTKQIDDVLLIGIEF
jgi:PAS domain S-box-containing protein